MEWTENAQHFEDTGRKLFELKSPDDRICLQVEEVDPTLAGQYEISAIVKIRGNHILYVEYAETLDYSKMIAVQNFKQVFPGWLKSQQERLKLIIKEWEGLAESVELTMKSLDRS